MLLELKSFSKSFNGNRVFDKLTINFQQHTLHALLGVNGSGKTTLFNIISGLITPDAGRVILNNTDITKFSVHKRARLGIRRSFQGANIFDSISVRQNILLALNSQQSFLRAALSCGAGEENVDALIDQFQLGEVQYHQAGEISFGQRRLLSLALAMALPFTVLLLDEPVAGLQPHYVELVANIIRNQSAMVVVIDHNLEFLEKLDCHAHFLAEGKIIESGKFQDVLSSKAVRAAYV